MTGKQENKIIIIIYGILFVAFAIIVFWKCRYGYATLDEAFYPTIAHRFIQGDIILFDEWNNSQLSNFVLIPVLKLYMGFNNGSLDGIYLFIRYTYTFFKCLISLWIFLKFKKFSLVGSALSSLIFLIFATAGLMVLSYNSLATGGLLCAFLLLMNDKKSVLTNIFCILAGICLSIAVLAIPYAAGIFIIYLVGVIGVNIYKKRKSVDIVIANFYSYNTLIFLSVGIGIMVGIFLLYVFSHATLDQVLLTIPHILLGDPAHEPKNAYYLTIAYLVRIFFGHEKNYALLCVYFLFFVLLGCYYLDKNKQKRKQTYLIVVSLLSLVLLVTYQLTDPYVNNFIFVPNVCALTMMFIDGKNNETVKYLGCIIIPGIVYTYFEYLASNTGFSGIAGASSVATVGSIIVIYIICSKYSKDLSLVKKAALNWIIPVILIILVYYRITYVFWDDKGIWNQTSKITNGPDKGLIVSEEAYSNYTKIYNDTQKIRKMNPETKVIYLSDKALYMAGDQRCASYSPLCYSFESGIVFDYYKEHPDKIADVIYIDEFASYEDSFIEKLCNELNLSLKNTEHGIMLMRK